MIKVDKIISATWIFTGEDQDKVLFDHSIVVNDKKIRDIQPTIKAHQIYEADETYQLSNHMTLNNTDNLRHLKWVLKHDCLISFRTC